ncbi:hypothetical protein [Micromonospora sp. NPDC092111]|uniref:hypothetical protein n=1 Tax=Micromonospora sp. NPDC092111 TaxID=3364289 RepID=UPI0037F5D543
MRAPGCAEDLAELLRVVRRQGTLGEVLHWLGRRIGAEVAWVGGTSTVEAATAGFRRPILDALDEQLRRLAAGRLAAVTAQVAQQSPQRSPAEPGRHPAGHADPGRAAPHPARDDVGGNLPPTPR